ncbi:MAG: hypothetical protein GXO19_03050 [Epsilonproteobacteria bacterium]|nr:hypothetical protein [Campylobacterota bacterium]
MEATGIQRDLHQLDGHRASLHAVSVRRSTACNTTTPTPQGGSGYRPLRPFRSGAVDKGER